MNLVESKRATPDSEGSLDLDGISNRETVDPAVEQRLRNGLRALVETTEAPFSVREKNQGGFFERDPRKRAAVRSKMRGEMVDGMSCKALLIVLAGIMAGTASFTIDRVNLAADDIHLEGIATTVVESLDKHIASLASSTQADIAQSPLSDKFVDPGDVAATWTDDINQSQR